MRSSRSCGPTAGFRVDGLCSISLLHVTVRFVMIGHPMLVFRNREVPNRDHTSCCCGDLACAWSLPRNCLRPRHRRASYSKPLPQDIVDAWKNAGADVGWMNAKGEFHHHSKPEVGDVPAFYFEKVAISVWRFRG